MKVDNKTIKVDQELTTEIDFNDNAINKLRIKEGKRKDFKFRNIKVPVKSAFINAETRGLTHRTIWCNISKKLERGES